MPVEFLSDEQVERFGQFAADPSPLELERFCFRLDAEATNRYLAEIADDTASVGDVLDRRHQSWKRERLRTRRS